MTDLAVVATALALFMLAFSFLGLAVVAVLLLLFKHHVDLSGKLAKHVEQTEALRGDLELLDAKFAEHLALDPVYEREEA